jgi:EAL domain-containing protein (putative c-di-GMP-specific phosphodiesterase class I)
MPITAALPVGCHISVPLRFKDGSLYGSFCALSRQADYSLTHRDLATVRAFADLAIDQIEIQRDLDGRRDAALRRIEDAIGSGQPAMVLQPIHDLTTGQPRGVEALARFRGDRVPSDWFAQAAELGIGKDLELAAVRAALATLPFVPEPLYLGFNASPQLVLSGALEPLIDAAPPHRLVVEVTEHAEVEDYRLLRAALAPFRDHIRVAVDDVGAGYSGLKHILDLSPDTLKLDMSLTRDVDTDAARRALIGAMVDFAAGIGCNMVAEGVETAAERDVLKSLGVGAAQGWLYSKALPPGEARRYLLAAAAPGEWAAA